MISLENDINLIDIDEVDKNFHTLNNRHNNIYKFVMRYNEYILSSHDYGEGIPLSMIEVHTLTFIEENPGTTVTELAAYWNKTKGAISQMVTKLNNKNLVEKKKKENNGKTVHLYVTEIGEKLSKSHKIYDTIDIAKTMKELEKECTPEEIDTFFKVIAIYNKVIEKDFEINKKK